MESISVLIALNIKRIRKNLGMTQTDLAVESGISFRGIQDIESGKRSPRKETLRAIAGALKVDEIDLLGRTENEKKNDEDYDSIMKKIDSLQIMTTDEIAKKVAHLLSQKSESPRVQPAQSSNSPETQKLVDIVIRKVSSGKLNIKHLAAINKIIDSYLSTGLRKTKVR